MKFIEKCGEIENIYEGTPTEIMDLYNRMNFKGVFKGKIMPYGDDAKELRPDMKGLNIIPTSITPITPQIYCNETNIDELASKLAKKMSEKIKANEIGM